MMNRKERWVLIIIIASAFVVFSTIVLFVANEVSRKVPVEPPEINQWNHTEKVLAVLEYENTLPGKWLSTADSTIIEFGWRKEFSISKDNEAYLYSVIKPNSDCYLVIRKMKCDTIFSVDSLTGGRKRSVNCTQVEYFKNRIISLDENHLKLASFMNDSNAVRFVKVE